MIASRFLDARMAIDRPTTTALLQGLFDPENEAVWEEFHARYQPIIVAVARRVGLTVEDAADVAQETLIKFFQEYRAGKYDRQRGRLRSWVVGIARYRIADLNRAKARRRDWRGESIIGSVPDEDHLGGLWDEECRREVLNHAMTDLRETTKLDARTIQAFQQLSLDQRSPSQVAEDMGMSIDAVYKAKQRCIEQLRVILARLNEVYEI